MSEQVSTQTGNTIADKMDFDRDKYELTNLSKTFCRFENCKYEQPVKNGTQPSVQLKCAVGCIDAALQKLDVEKRSKDLDY